MKSLVLMIQFMTRYPVPIAVDFTVERFVAGMKWMPLVGLLVGLPAAGCFLLADNFLGLECAAIVSVMAGLVITGGLHLDGLADTADGIFSYRSRERMLEIMRDSVIGTNGVLALISCLLLKFVFLKNITATGALIAVLYTPVLGRTALVWHSAVAQYARDGKGLGEYVNQTGVTEAMWATLFSLLLAVFLLAFTGMAAGVILGVVVLLQVFAIAVAVIFAAYLKKKIGGITGDTIGATVEITETVGFFLFLLIWRFIV